MASGDVEPGEADESPTKDSKLNTVTHECEACANPFPLDELVQLPCDDQYCKACLEKMFEASMKDETVFPPRCCGRRIRTNLARKYLPKSLLRKFVALQPELEARDKTYCHRRTCSAFIPSHSIHAGNGLAICQTCFAVTCSRCRKEWHWGHCSDDRDEEFFSFFLSKKWKQCPGCRRVVEKNTGCNHMTCRCGTDFCYLCGEEMSFCRDHSEAGDDDEEGEEEEGEEVVNDQPLEVDFRATLTAH